MPVKLTPLSAPIRKTRDQPHKRFARAPVAPRRVAVEPEDSEDNEPARGGGWVWDEDEFAWVLSSAPAGAVVARLALLIERVLADLRGGKPGAVR